MLLAWIAVRVACAQADCRLAPGPLTFTKEARDARIQGTVRAILSFPADGVPPTVQLQGHKVLTPAVATALATADFGADCFGVVTAVFEFRYDLSGCVSRIAETSPLHFSITEPFVFQDCKISCGYRIVKGRFGRKSKVEFCRRTCEPGRSCESDATPSDLK